MPRDYKDRVSRRPSRNPLPGWLWLIAGLSIGLFVAFFVHLYEQGYRPFAARRPVAQPTRLRPAENTPKAEPRPSKPAPPRFDFYTILPEMEVLVPSPGVEPQAGRPQPAVPKKLPAGTYVLQAGSFRKHSQADQLKARLALLGVEAKIDTVTINNKDTWHRVRVGPFRNQKQLNEVRARLKENHISAILIKQSG
jgi:cell division protein FtsN